MKKQKMPKSLRKYIRREKARIRREVLNLEEQEKLIQELFSIKKIVNQEKNKKIKLEQKNENSTNLQSSNK